MFPRKKVIVQVPLKIKGGFFLEISTDLQREESGLHGGLRTRRVRKYGLFL